MVALTVWLAPPAEARPCDPPVVLVNGEEVTQGSPTLKCAAPVGPLRGGGPRPRGLLGDFPVLGNLPGLGGIL